MSHKIQLVQKDRKKKILVTAYHSAKDMPLVGTVDVVGLNILLKPLTKDRLFYHQTYFSQTTVYKYVVRR